MRISILLLPLILLAGCAALDKALLEPATDEDGVELYYNPETDEERPKDEIPEDERDDWEPVYDAVKDVGTDSLPSPWAELGAVAAALISVYGAVRLRKRWKDKKGKSETP